MRMLSIKEKGYIVMADHKKEHENESTEKISRRRFLQYSGMTIAGTVVMGSALPGCSGPAKVEQAYLEMTEEERRQKKVCAGYILIDSRKCMGCLTCMIGCSMVHEGEMNLSLSRLQVTQNPLGKFPNEASSFLVMAISGGFFIPLLFGLVADSFSLKTSLIIVVLPLLLASWYGFLGARRK